MSFVGLSKYLETSHQGCIPARKEACNAESIRVACETLPGHWPSFLAQFIEQYALRKHRTTSLHITQLIAMHTEEAGFSIVAAHIRLLLQSIWVIIDADSKHGSLSSVQWTDNTRVDIATEILEGLSLCSAGLYERLYLLYQKITGEPSIEEYLFRYRLEIVTHVAHQYFAVDKIDEMLEVHERERYLQAAASIGLRLQTSSIDSKTYNKRHRLRVIEAMSERYTPLQIVYYIETQLYDLLRAQGYQGCLENEYGYSSGEYQQWQDAIATICEAHIPSAQLFIQAAKTEAVIDINRSFILQLIIHCLVNKHIMIPQASHLALEELITNQRDRLLWAAEYANFENYRQAVQILPLSAQKMMIRRSIRHRFQQTEPESHREMIDQFYDETIEKLYEAGELQLPEDSKILLLHRRFALGPDPIVVSYRRPLLKVADIIILLNQAKYHYFLIENLLTAMMKYSSQHKLALMQALCENLDAYEGGALVYIQRSPVLIHALLQLITSCDKHTQLKIMTYVNKTGVGLIAGSMLHGEKKAVWFTEKLLDCLCAQDRANVVRFLETSLYEPFNLFAMIFTYDSTLYHRLHDYYTTAKQQIALARFIQCVQKSTSCWYGAWFHERTKEKALEQYSIVTQCHVLSVDEMKNILLEILRLCSVIRSATSDINKQNYPKSFSMACYLLGQEQFISLYSLIYGQEPKHQIKECELLAVLQAQINNTYEQGGQKTGGELTLSL